MITSHSNDVLIIYRIHYLSTKLYIILCTQKKKVDPALNTSMAKKNRDNQQNRLRSFQADKNLFKRFRIFHRIFVGFSICFQVL